jgi:hypothetical protein
VRWVFFIDQFGLWNRSFRAGGTELGLSVDHMGNLAAQVVLGSCIAIPPQKGDHADFGDQPSL